MITDPDQYSESEQIVKFLIIRFSSIGDIILTTPVVRGLKQQVENSEIHFVVKKEFAQLLESNPYIDYIHVYDRNMKKLKKGLRLEGFDYVIDLHRNIRSMMIKSALRRMSFSFNKLNIKKYLAVRFKKIQLLPDIHIVDRYFKTTYLFDVENDKKGLDYFIPESSKINPYDISEKLKKPYVVIVTGAGHYTKQIPVDLLVKLIDKIHHTVVLIGSKEDKGKADKVIESVQNKDVVNTCGMYDFNQSASIVEQSSVVISPDTGYMHIAAALKKTVLSVWGNTIPEFGMYPYLPGEGSERFEVKNLSCRPCSKLGFDKCPKKHFDCMYKQDIQTIADKVNSLMKS